MSEVGEGLGGLAGFINQLLDAGVESATAGLGAFREAGGSITTQEWYDQWGTTSAARAMAPELATVDYGAHLGDDAFAEWSYGRPGTYYHQVTIVSRDVDTGATEYQQFTVTSRQPMAPQLAVDEALDEWEAAAEEYGQRVRGAFLSGAYKSVGRRP